MATTDTARANHTMLFGAHTSALAETDPEFVEVFEDGGSRSAAESQLKGHVAGNANVGNGRAVLIDVATQLLPWIGYPRTLNALACVREVLPPT